MICFMREVKILKIGRREEGKNENTRENLYVNSLCKWLQSNVVPAAGLGGVKSGSREYSLTLPHSGRSPVMRAAGAALQKKDLGVRAGKERRHPRVGWEHLNE